MSDLSTKAIEGYAQWVETIPGGKSVAEALRELRAALTDVQRENESLILKASAGEENQP